MYETLLSVPQTKAIRYQSRRPSSLDRLHYICCRYHSRKQQSECNLTDDLASLGTFFATKGASIMAFRKLCPEVVRRSRLPAVNVPEYLFFWTLVGLTFGR